MIELGREICSDLQGLLSREWLETNGIGGYASATVAGANTRRYHGLLIAATNPPLGRVVTLSKFEEIIVINGEQFALSCSQYPRTIYPDGYKFLKKFRLDPFPVWTYEVNGTEVERSVFMVDGENTTVCQWKLIEASKGQDIDLEVRPLMAFRDHHHLRREEASFDGHYEVDGGLVSMTPYAELPTLHLATNALTVIETGHWYRDFEYSIERERGFDYHEDLFQPFALKFDLNENATIIASTQLHKETETNELETAELKRRASLVVHSNVSNETLWPLVLAADQFIVKRGKGKSVIAGYHWFSDWGRDTMISLPGLTLATNRPEIAKSILTEFADHISQGMIPNRFPDAGDTPDYNTVDATLWYFEAIRVFLEKTGDQKFVREVLYNKLVDIIDWHVRGTRYGIHVDTDGLLCAGEPGVQLTWMDAKVGEWVVTPRTGKPVEIQALWYNAICIMSDLAIRFGDKDQQSKYSRMDEVARESFNGQFWNERDDCLFDVVDGEQKDISVRPNQIFAVSLHHTMLEHDRARKVVDKVESELLTPVGLRSLSPRDPRYVGVYFGSPMERDAAYHQGTVWAWLIGPFIEAFRKTHSAESDVESRVGEMLSVFQEHLNEAMVGQISEIFDGDAPHWPRGCAAQAWSVAEFLRVSLMSSE